MAIDYSLIAIKFRRSVLIMIRYGIYAVVENANKTGLKP